MKKRLIASCLAVVLIMGCSAASALQAVAKWSPVGLAAFDGLIAIVAPAQAAVYQKDAAAVGQAFADLGAATTNTAALSNLSAIVTGVEKVVADILPIIPLQDQQYVQDGETVLNVTIAAFQAELGGSSTPAPAVNTAHNRFQPYADGSYFVMVDYDPDATINYASGGQAAKANPTASTGKAKAPKLGAFKKQMNAVCKRHGKAPVFKLSMLEKMGLK